MNMFEPPDSIAAQNSGIVTENLAFKNAFPPSFPQAHLKLHSTFANSVSGANWDWIVGWIN